MNIELRPYQQNVVNDAYRAWANKLQDILIVMPTGAGKAFTLSFIAREYASRGHKVIIQVHRRELLAQLSISLAQIGVMHTFIASKSTTAYIRMLHQQKFGRVFVDGMARVCLASAQTLVNKKGVDVWASQVGLKVTDEAHHLVRENTWGRCWEKFPDACGLGVTATPARTSGEGLGRHADGYFDYMVLGPTMRELISIGALSEYRIFAPPTDICMDKLRVGANGEFVANSVEEALSGSHIVSNAVTEYKRIMDGLPAIVFGRSVENSNDIARAFNDNGIRAMSLSSNNTDEERGNAMRDFVSGKLQILSNFALYDEGLDVPGLYGVIDCQPSKSIIKFHQKFGRMLRTAPSKTHGFYIDMVHNIRVNDVGTHALPDSPMLWSLDRRKKRSIEEQNNILSLTNCLKCFEVYRAELLSCPHCGAVKPTGMGRPAAAPIQIDDDLIELTPQTLAQLRGEIDQSRRDSTEAMMEKFGVHAQGIIPMKWRKDHKQRKAALSTLDNSISLWAGLMKSYGLSDDDIHSAFHRAYGMNILYARSLKKADAEKLLEKINCVLVDNGVLLTR